MKWPKVTENMIGGNYTWFDLEVEGGHLLALLYCIGDAFPARDPPSDDYDELPVKRYFARTMREYARVHCEAKDMVAQLLLQYKLQELC